MDYTNADLNKQCEQATEEFNRIGAKLERLQELQTQGKGNSEEAAQIAAELLEE